MFKMKALNSNLKNILQKERFKFQNLILTRRLANEKRSSVTISNNKGDGQVSTHVKVGEWIKQTGKDVVNLTVILAGIGIAGGVAWIVFKEFFSSKSPSSIFSSALDKCKQDDRVTDELGDSIKGHGEMTRRGRARHVAFGEYKDASGRTLIRVKFHLKGSNGKSATVQCETAKDSPRASFRYLVVQMDQYPHRAIVVEDNRLLDEK